MSAALILLAKQRGDVNFVHQVLFYPVTDANFHTDSYHQFAEGYFLRRDAMEWFWDQYTTDPAQRAEITASPLRASLDELAGLPPALVITGEADVLRDEGEAYASKLRAAGVPVDAVRYQGIIHDFVMLNAPRDTTPLTPRSRWRSPRSAPSSTPPLDVRRGRGRSAVRDRRRPWHRCFFCDAQVVRPSRRPGKETT
jgi:acetyl esterase/lipase